VEPRVISVPGVFGSIRFSVVFLLIFDLLCFVKRISSSPCISLAVVALFIKRGESLFREIMSSDLLWPIIMGNIYVDFAVVCH
jgi:hypothetical protein